MEIILLEDLRHLGKRGEVVNVKTGFARNYLLPQGKALESTVGNRAYFDQQRKRIDAEHAKERDAAAEVAALLAGLTITIAKKAGETDTLYGSVTASEVAAALESKGVVINKRKIDLGGGIKTLGDHTASVDLHTEIIAEVAIQVVPSE